VSDIYQIVMKPTALRELEKTRVFERRRIADAIRENLTREPGVSTANRKRLDGVAPSFEHTQPVWELRVGQLRVFYDISEEEKVVYVRAIRPKRSGQMTEDVVS
jgi:mRNA-degrading endonuclease RelE of RelBE toxin-antitoxin system